MNIHRATGSRSNTLDVIGLLVTQARNLIPLVTTVAFFQLLVLREAFPHVWSTLGGFLALLVGLALIVRGIAMSLLPIGSTLSERLVAQGSLRLFLGFCFALGFASTVAEPALSIVVATATTAAAASGAIAPTDSAQTVFSVTLRVTSAIGVGLALALGILRILRDWPLTPLVVGTYLLTALAALIIPAPMTTALLDASAAATSVVNIPLVTALGVGLATIMPKRDPLTDGFGMVALCSIMPALFMLVTAAVLGAVQ